MTTIFTQLTTPLQRTRVDVFEEIFLPFLALGTLIGIVVIGYTLYNAYKYRDDGTRGEDEDLPAVGELPTGGKGGRKLFLSFGVSAVIVLSLVFGAYQALLFVEAGPDPAEDESIDVQVQGQAFSWTFIYENGVESTGEFVVPADTTIWLDVTSVDVWHAFGIPEYRVKNDAIPGESHETWFIADPPENDESETYTDGIECFELCGAGHSDMKADLVVMEPAAFEEWLAEEEAALEEGNESGGNESADNGSADEGPTDNASSGNESADEESTENASAEGADNGSAGNESANNGSTENASDEESVTTDGTANENEDEDVEAPDGDSADTTAGNETDVDNEQNENETNQTDGNATAAVSAVLGGGAR